MKRRNFLRLLGVASAAAGIPTAVAEAQAISPKHGVIRIHPPSNYPAITINIAIQKPDEKDNWRVNPFILPSTTDIPTSRAIAPAQIGDIVRIRGVGILPVEIEINAFIAGELVYKLEPDLLYTTL